MRPLLLVAAVLMLLYLMASFLGAGDIWIIYVAALAAQSLSSGKLPFGGVYEAGVAVYVIAMIGLFIAAGAEAKE